MLCYGSPMTRVPASSATVFSCLEPLLHLLDHITSCIFSHTAKQDSQPIASVISKQVDPYHTFGGTCCPRVSTPKTRSLADLSMTNHTTWRNPTISTIQSHAQTMASILTTVNSHHDILKTNTLNNNTSQTEYHIDGKTCTTLMTTWLSITNQVWIQILSMRLR
jgi:hypothetical protein